MNLPFPRKSPLDIPPPIPYTIPIKRESRCNFMEKSGNGEPWVVSSTSGVKLRKGPGSDEQIGALGLGATVYVTKQSEDGKWGWVASSEGGSGSWGKTSGGWINLEPCCKGIPSKWAVTASSLNLRQKADVASKSLALLPKNTQLTVTTQKKNGDYTWGFVAYAQKPNDEWHMREGWVALEHCKKK